MSKRIPGILIGLVLLTVSVHARQTATRITGTVTAIEGDHIQIKDQAGKAVIVMLQKNTRYLKAEKTATKAELKVGIRVDMEVKMDDKMKMYAADKVTIGAADAGPAPSGAGGTKAR
jgi:nitrate reductase NapAB chaperone NapD